MKVKLKLKSVSHGDEWDLSNEQISYLNKKMRRYGCKDDGKHFPCIQGRRFGLVSFAMPKCGYFSHIGTSEFKTLKKLAKKSDTSIYINNTLPDSMKVEDNIPRISFYAKGSYEHEQYAQKEE